MPFYGSQEWDPKLIVAQIVALQCLSYITYGMLLSLFHTLFGTAFTLEQFFGYQSVDAGAPTGWVVILSSLSNAVVSAVFLSLIVERAKKCLDFAFTNHVLHLIFCTLYESFPSNWEWWVLDVASMIILAVVGKFPVLRY
mmetsp:Transcript_8032/g.15951  ORF Transcript_8032/g.15951 Transcript_8032/m.15951 type:complete len:140 (-) Transcript_8032:863-1282(-)